MKKILVASIIFSVSMASCFSRNSDLDKEFRSLIEAAMEFKDPNPTHKNATQSIFNKFIKTLEIKLFHQEEEPVNKNSFFDLLLENSSSFYDDDIDSRRMRHRRSLCFASLALTSDYEKALTFLKYAKFSLYDSQEKPRFILLENQMLGLLLIELLLNYQNDQNIDAVKLRIRDLIKTHQPFLKKDLAKSTEELLTKLSRK